jgi:hypothetical protein
LQLLAIELDQRLTGFYAISKIGEDTIDDALDLRGDGHFGFGGERADHLNGAADGILTHSFRFHDLRGLFALPVLWRF